MIYKVKQYYVTPVDPPNSESKKDCTYVETITLHPTSIYGQIESCGWVKNDLMEKLSQQEEDKIQQQYNKIVERSKQISKIFAPFQED